MNQKEIARLAGVSSATVSRVINHDPNVSPETASRVMNVISQHGYVQNIVARSLRVSRTNTVGFLVPDISNPFFPMVLKGIEAVFAQRGYRLILASTDEDPLREADVLDTLLRSRVDGLIAILVDETGCQIQAFSEMGIPVVLIDRRVYGEERQYDCVTIDNAGGVMKAVAYLAGLGHVRIGFIHGDTRISPGKERLFGFVRGMETMHIPMNPDYVVDGQFTEEQAYAGVKMLMRLDDPPTAIITSNNMMSMGAFRALVDLGIDIPSELSLLGFDDFPLAGYLNPPLTVVDRPTAEMGAIGAKILLDHITGSPAAEARTIVLPTELLVRGSCAPPRI